ncbi:VOC family protein [Limoniibacter endophyticus]|uniref:Riboflavin deaminase n=1 Tax=Limoniibacter endophyticus TaxID=1565040 RepID=A0A8J3DKN7_9HYPH|nr:VOC family protein [Limoniibacter endophyticus]GHC65288.1 riboflavin deaminase [Limoniibacter endophyticus]
MLKLDHIAVIAPSLEEGAAHIRAQLGIEMPKGGEHPQMGTHNLLLRLGDDVFLEVIAINPDAPKPARARWFGLDDQHSVRRAWDDGRRLRGWVSQTDELNRLLREHGDLLGEKIHVTRGNLEWDFAVRADGEIPADGVLSPVMDWGARGNPAINMPDLGARLIGFEIEHPEPEKVQALYTRIGIENPPIVSRGDRLSYRAFIETPGGLKTLT